METLPPYKMPIVVTIDLERLKEIALEEELEFSEKDLKEIFDRLDNSDLEESAELTINADIYTIMAEYGEEIEGI